MLTLISFSIALLSATALQSPFNSHEVFLTPRNMPGACSGQDPEQFRNRRYTVLGDQGGAFTLHDGKLVDAPLGTPEVETTLVTAKSLNIAGRMATLLIMRTQLVHSLGGRTYVLVVECRNRKLSVSFEASGEGINDVSFTEANQTLTVSRWVWSATDAHCCPGKKAEERYRVGSLGAFARVTGSTK
jgi:hypothetical protein